VGIIFPLENTNYTGNLEPIRLKLKSMRISNCTALFRLRHTGGRDIPFPQKTLGQSLTEAHLNNISRRGKSRQVKSPGHGYGVRSSLFRR
jgi:hypothetical protein